MTGKNLLALSFRLVGLTFLVVAAVVSAYTLAFVLRSEEIQGTVVGHSRIQNKISIMPEGDESGNLFYPVIAYEGEGGQPREFTGPSGRPDPQYAIGQGVLIRVSGVDNARIATPMGTWGTSLILAAVAVVFFVLSLAAPHGFGGFRRPE